MDGEFFEQGESHDDEIEGETVFNDLELARTDSPIELFNFFNFSDTPSIIGDRIIKEIRYSNPNSYQLKLAFSYFRGAYEVHLSNANRSIKLVANNNGGNPSYHLLSASRSIRSARENYDNAKRIQGFSPGYFHKIFPGREADCLRKLSNRLRISWEFDKPGELIKLEEGLAKAVGKEDYRRAAEIKKQVDRRVNS